MTLAATTTTTLSLAALLYNLLSLSPPPLSLLQELVVRPLHFKWWYDCSLCQKIQREKPSIKDPSTLFAPPLSPHIEHCKAPEV
jgi:hypothetical protein